MRALFFCAALSSTSAQAGIVSDTWGIFTDPFKLQASSENAISAVHQARSAALAVVSSLSDIQARTDTNIKEYLADIDSKLSRIEELGSNFISQINDLEDKIMVDIFNLLKEAECSAHRVGRNTVYDQVLAKLPDALVSKEVTYQMPFGSQRTYVFFGLIPWGEEPATFVYNIEGSDPYTQFREVEAAYLSSLDNAPPDGAAIMFPATYANLANLAAKTACEFKGTEFEELFMARKFVEYNALIIPWGHAVRVNF